jgi:hypothetical protein
VTSDWLGGLMSDMADRFTDRSLDSQTSIKHHRSFKLLDVAPFDDLIQHQNPIKVQSRFLHVL